MLIDLIAAFKDVPRCEILQDCKEEKDPVVAQSSFHFDTTPQIVFVKDLHKRSRAGHYSSLPTVPLRSKEQKIYADTLKQLSTNPKFYNGKQMLLTGAVYDTTKNILYLEAVRVDYAFLVALEKMKQVKAAGSVLHNKDFFKTGVLAPFISSDNKVAIIARTDKWKLRSVAAGFLECKDETDSLSNLIQLTAIKEADEEFAVSRVGHRRLDFTKVSIASISFRDAIGMGMTPTIEFIAPLQATQDADYVLRMMNINTASHAHEHLPGTAFSIPLEANMRDKTTSRLLSQGLPGSFLYGPVTHACAQLVNSEMPLAARIDGIPYSRFYPIGIFKPSPRKALEDTTTQQIFDDNKNCLVTFKAAGN